MKYVVSILVLFLAGRVAAQELNCRVTVNATPAAQQVIDKRVFQSLQKQVYEFMNNTQWTTDQFKRDEKIDCNLLINVTKVNPPDEFEATITVQSERPIFNSSYKSVMLNYQDNDFTFRYLEYQQFLYSENSFLSNLTSVLAYYAYVIIAMDYDSYALKGGTPYWTKAQSLVQFAQNAPEKGWRSSDGFRNRYWLVENILNPVFEPMRECNYNWHMKGMDIMYDQLDNGRTAILDCLDLLQKVHKARPASFNMQVFFSAKAQEIVNIFSEALPADKNRAINVLNQIDATNQNKYAKIMGP
jgi:hypothetical protein